MQTELTRVAAFVARIDALLEAQTPEPALLRELRGAMAALVAHDDWLPEACAQPHPTYYRQYLLHRDPKARFSIVSFVWGPGQRTPIHDHTVWGVIGMLRGSERAQAYRRDNGRLVAHGDALVLQPGDVELVAPSIGDIHRVSNAYDDRVSISVHAYGADIGRVRRHVFDAESGAAQEFVSGYANA